MNKHYIYTALILCITGIYANGLNIVIYSPLELGGYWDSHTINKNISGGEYVIIELSNELAKLGSKVSIYSTPDPNSPATYEYANPRYRHYNEINWQEIADNVDILILWRTPYLINLANQNLNFREKKPLIYFIPIDAGESIRDANIDTLQNFFWSSNTQKNDWCRFNPQLQKFNDIIGYGVDLELFSQDIKERKNKYSCMYASAYGRGLDILLDSWPTIKAEFPEAELNIYFGTRNWCGYPTGAQQKILDLKSLDVKEHGWVSNEEIVKAYEENSFWTYPCIAPEMFCISGLKAQVAGCIPVIYDTAALKDTVKYGYISNSSEEYINLIRKAFKDAEALTPEVRSELSKTVIPTASWTYIANKLINIFELDIKSKNN